VDSINKDSTNLELPPPRKNTEIPAKTNLLTYEEQKIPPKSLVDEAIGVQSIFENEIMNPKFTKPVFYI